jgi:hypothetical protein
MDKAAGESFAPTTREKQPKTKEDDNLDVTLSRYSFQAGAYADTPTRPNAHTLRPRRYALPAPTRRHAPTPIRSARADTLCPRRHVL